MDSRYRSDYLTAVETAAILGAKRAVTKAEAFAASARADLDAEIAAVAQNGVKHKAIAQALGVSRRTVCSIVKRAAS